MIHSTYIVEEIRQSIENDDKLIVRNMPQFYFYPSRRIAMILCRCNKKKLRQTIIVTEITPGNLFLVL